MTPTFYDYERECDEIDRGIMSIIEKDIKQNKKVIKLKQSKNITKNG